MSHIKLVAQVKLDTEFPRDLVQFTHHFNVGGGVLPGVNDLSLCTDLANLINVKLNSIAPTVWIRVTSYNSATADDGYPRDSYTKNPTQAAVGTVVPRDVALCLSYYADRNEPRRRGRIYLPAPLMFTAVGSKPTAPQITKALDYGDGLASLGGLDCDWEVWSVRNQAGYKISNMWVDNEWDTQRRRGLKADARTLRSTSG